jgi:hypothetical protein
VLEEFLNDPQNQAGPAIFEDFQRMNDLAGQRVGLLLRAYDRAQLQYDQEQTSEANGGPPPGSNWSQRLDLNADNSTSVVGDVLKFAGKIGATCN